MSRKIHSGNSKLDYEGIPWANQTYWFKCENCDNLHVCLEDVDGELIATMVLDVDMLDNMLDCIHGPPNTIQRPSHGGRNGN